MKEIKQDQYLGGVLSIARNLFQITDKISIISMLGEKKEYLNDIKKNFTEKIKTNFIYKKNSPTIVKRRFIDSISQSKVIGIYNINDEILSKSDENLFNKLLIKEIKKYDLVIVSDYGHGLISKKCKHYL